MFRRFFKEVPRNFSKYFKKRILHTKCYFPTAPRTLRKICCGKCKFGTKYCWFLHKEDEKHEVISNNDAQIKENDEVVARLLNLVENLSERIKKLECGRI